MTMRLLRRRISRSTAFRADSKSRGEAAVPSLRNSRSAATRFSYSSSPSCAINSSTRDRCVGGAAASSNADANASDASDAQHKARLRAITGLPSRSDGKCEGVVALRIGPSQGATSGIHLDRLDDLVEVVGHLDR